MKIISYKDAIKEAIQEEMENDPTVFVIGGETKMFGSLNGIEDKFGKTRVITTPISEDATTGLVLGAAMTGLRPIQVHIRVDFMLLAVNQIINMISTAIYNSNGNLKVPLLIRAVVGRGWGQGFQHSKSLHGLFAQIPGLKVIMPTSPKDAKGMIKKAIRFDGPVICIENRWLYWQEGEIPEEDYTVELNLPECLRKGSDLTIVASSWMNVEAKLASEILNNEHGIQVAIFDIKSTDLTNFEQIFNSVNATGKCIVADNDWLVSGLSGEIAFHIQKKCFRSLDLPIERIGFEQVPCPTARELEEVFYPNAFDIVRKSEDMLGLKSCSLESYELYSHEIRFKGPF
jgi:pyruvate/2-oxoglutarate/acetoin dehydrogenase E1 component